MKVHNSAGFWVRLMAIIIDGIIVGVTGGILSAMISGEFRDDSFTLTDILSPLYYIILPVIWYGYTLGKRALGIRIARMDGKKVGIGTMLLRHLVAGIVYALTIGIGVIVSAFMVGLREDKRAIHDFIAGTYVTHDLPEDLY